MKIFDGKGLCREIELSFSWRQTEILRGISIILIMLHNLLHMYPGILGESEFNYSITRISFFFDKLHHGSPVLIYDMLSFLGWYGVPVFVFLSGYGLTKRYDAGLCSSTFKESHCRSHFSIWNFIKLNWLKLVKLMALGILIFACDYIVTCLKSGINPDFAHMLNILLPLTCLNDTVQLWLPTVPGVYWYFGLAFELYIIYAFAVRGRSEKWLWILTGLCFCAFIFFRKHPPIGTEVEFEEYMRHNFIGWMLPFACGIWLARHPIQKLYNVLGAGILCIILFLPSFKTVYTWQLTSVFAVGLIVMAGILFDKIPYWGGIWQQIGKLSAYLYVVHPIVRHLTRFYTFGSSDPIPTVTTCLLYLSLAFIATFIYRWLTNLIFREKRTGSSR